MRRKQEDKVNGMFLWSIFTVRKKIINHYRWELFSVAFFIVRLINKQRPILSDNKKKWNFTFLEAKVKENKRKNDRTLNFEEKQNQCWFPSFSSSIDTKKINTNVIRWKETIASIIGFYSLLSKNWSSSNRKHHNDESLFEFDDRRW